MKIIIIGAADGGTSAAAKVRRNDEEAEIIIFEKNKDISYSGFGLPYYIWNEVIDKSKLGLRKAMVFKSKYNVNIFTEHEVLNLDAEVKILTVKNLKTKEIYTEHFDKLIISTGARSIIPDISGVNNVNVFCLSNVQSADRVKAFIKKNNPKKAIIIGSGLIGFEMIENLKNLGINITVVDFATQVMTQLDKDMVLYMQKYLDKKEINFILDDSVAIIKDEFPNSKIILRSGMQIEADFVITAVGVKPNIEFVQRAGIEIGESGAIKVNKKMQTNFDYIYACGDCSESYSLITGKNVYRPLASTANKTGKIAGDSVTGRDLKFRGILGTGIFKVFDLAVAYTGLSEKKAINEGYEVVVCHNIKPDKATTYYDDKEMIIKTIADKDTGKLLGVQIVGINGVDKRIDVFATAITFGARVQDLFELDLVYDSSSSLSKNLVMYTGSAVVQDLLINNKFEKSYDLADGCENYKVQTK